MEISNVRCKCGTLDKLGPGDIHKGTLRVDVCPGCYEALLAAKNAAVLDNQRTDRYVPPSLDELEQYAGEWV